MIECNLIKGFPNIKLDSLSEEIGVTWSNGTVYDQFLIEMFYAELAKKQQPFVVVDVGAQTGCFSLLAKFLPLSYWYSFEPLQKAADTLLKNLRLNDIQNVSVCRAAVSDFAGQATLKMPGMHDWGLATLASIPLRFHAVTEETVPCIALDSFVREKRIAKVDFIKIDTEGWELHVLRGAKNLLLRDRPILLFEHSEINMRQCRTAAQEVRTFLKELRYDYQPVGLEDWWCTPID